MKRVTSSANLAQRLDQELQNLARKQLSLKQVAQLVKLQSMEPQKALIKTSQTATWGRESMVILMLLLDLPRNLHNHFIQSPAVVVLPITAVATHPNHPSFLNWRAIQRNLLRGRLLRFKETRRTECIVTVLQKNRTGIGWLWPRHCTTSRGRWSVILSSGRVKWLRLSTGQTSSLIGGRARLMTGWESFLQIMSKFSDL